jgi:hypothetical protein
MVDISQPGEKVAAVRLDHQRSRPDQYGRIARVNATRTVGAAENLDLGQRQKCPAQAGDKRSHGSALRAPFSL